MQKSIYGFPSAPQPSSAKTVTTIQPAPPSQPSQPSKPPKAAPVDAYIKRVTDIMTNLKANMDKDVALARLDTLKAEVDVVLTRTPAK